MPRKFYRRRYRAPADKYSVERTTIRLDTAAQLVNGAYQATANVVPATPTQGMRKVKHITASLTAQTATFFWWAVVYVPEGYTVNPLNCNPGASLYEPNQFVMASGFNDTNAGPIRIHVPISRNLNSGDSIWIVGATNVSSDSIAGSVQYAITLQ